MTLSCRVYGALFEWVHDCTAAMHRVHCPNAHLCIFYTFGGFKTSPALEYHFCQFCLQNKTLCSKVNSAKDFCLYYEKTV